MMALVGELSQILQWPSNLWTSSAKDPNFKWKNPSQIWKTYILYTLKFRGILHNTFDTKKNRTPKNFPDVLYLHHLFTTIAVKPPHVRSWKWTQTSSNLDATFEMGRDWWIDVICLVSWFILIYVRGPKKGSNQITPPFFSMKSQR